MSGGIKNHEAVVLMWRGTVTDEQRIAAVKSFNETGEVAPPFFLQQWEPPYGKDFDQRQAELDDRLWAAKTPLKIYLGWDSREVAAYEVAVKSLRRHSSAPLDITPLQLPKLELAGLMRRPRRPGFLPGSVWDVLSNAPMSTEFANSRFLTPLLAQSGWALFADSDIVALADVAELFALADPDKAIMCVHHEIDWPKGHALKMDGQVQTDYKRKNWSSVVLYNCDHPKNLGLTLDMINGRPGRDLHAFCWLDDDDIGTLPGEWNWLVNVQARPQSPKLAHFTLGGPWLPDWKRQPHDDIWLGASQDC